MEFNLCENGDASGCYDATGAMYVYLDDMRDVFQFSCSDLSSGTLTQDNLDLTSSTTKYYCNSNSYPDINPAHAMMNDVNSEGAFVDYNHFLKHDFIFYISKKIFNTTSGFAFFNNKRDLLDGVELMGWHAKSFIESILETCDNSGNGLDNSSTTNVNLTRELLLQLKNHEIEKTRLEAQSTNVARIIDTSANQSFPFVDGDSINIFLNFTPGDKTIQSIGQSNQDIPPRKYRLKLILTEGGVVNDIPTESLSNENHNIVSGTGVPTIPL